MGAQMNNNFETNLRDFNKYKNLIPNYLSYAKVKIDANTKEALGIFQNAKRFSIDMQKCAEEIEDATGVELAQKFQKDSEDGIDKCYKKLEKTK